MDRSLAQRRTSWLGHVACDPSKTETDGGGEASTTNHPGEV